MAQPLTQQFAAAFKAWQDAGGVEDNFKMYMLGSKQIKPVAGDTAFALRQIEARISEVAGIVEQLDPPAPTA